jgi:hypothetical protein
VRKTYQNEEIDTSQPALPDTVSVALAELAGDLRDVAGLEAHCQPVGRSAHDQ